jgi:hypothetical protein
MSNNWRYDLRCEKCGTVITYAALPKDKYNWHEFYKVLLITDWNNHYNHCEECNLWTKQILLSFDKSE